MSQEDINAAFIAAGGIPKNPLARPNAGRDPDYKPEYCQDLINFFDVEPFRPVPETWYNPDGSVKRETMKMVPNPPAHLSQWARKTGISSATVYNWARAYPEFLEALSHARAIRKAQVIDNSLTGLYNPIFAKLAAANWFDWHDKQETHHSGEVKNTIIRYTKPDRDAPE